MFLESSVPLIFFFSHCPLCVVSFANGVLLSTDIIKANACSAVAFAFPPGVFITIMFFSLAVGTSILSTPAPALPMTFKFFAASIIFLVTFVADLTTIPS